MRIGTRCVGLGRYRWARQYMRGTWSVWTALRYACGWEPRFDGTDGVNGGRS